MQIPDPLKTIVALHKNERLCYHTFDDPTDIFRDREENVYGGKDKQRGRASV